MEIKLCKFCKKELIFSGRDKRNQFCNHSCAASFNNALRHKTYICNFCNKVIETNNVKFCNKNCYSLYTRHKSNSRISKGEVKCRLSIKRFLVEQFGHSCQICHTSMWQGQPIGLILDHIDGNADNNLLTNLRLVCANCDMQLPTYKSKNKGNGRAYRRERYAQGKSY